MNYANSLKYLESFINYEQSVKNPKNREFNLKRMEYLLELFDHPEKSFYPVLIAGTNGKGTVGRQLEALFCREGLKVGLYSSPHLINVRERIRFQKKDISETFWAKDLSTIQNRLKKKPLPKSLGKLTYFELLTFLAILSFSKKVNVGIFEIGMGGRLDAANVLYAATCVITKIDFDHEAFLGNTLKKIAYEKSHIVKSNSDVFTCKQSPEALREVKKRCVAVGAKLKVSAEKSIERVNADMAVQAYHSVCRRMNRKGASKNAAMKHALGVVVQGRLQEIRVKGQEFLLDVAHNPASINRLVNKIKSDFKSKDKWLMYSALRDKKSTENALLLSRVFENVILTQIDNPRAESLAQLRKDFSGKAKNIFLAENVQESLELVKFLSRKEDLVVVTGSFYLLGEFYRRVY